MDNIRFIHPREAVQNWATSLRIAPDLIARYTDLAEVLFFASMEQEEKCPVRVQIVFHRQGIAGVGAETEESSHEGTGHSPRLAWHVIPFPGSIGLNVKSLAKLSPAVYAERTAVVVGLTNERMQIEGLARRDKERDGGTLLIFSAPKPGVIVILGAERELFRYEHGRESPQQLTLYSALFDDGLIKRILEKSCESYLRQFPPSIFHPKNWGEMSRIFIRLIKTMISTNRGGIIAILTTEEHVTNNGNTTGAPLFRFFPTLLHPKIKAAFDARERMFSLTRIGEVTADERREQRLASEEVQDATRELDDTIDSIGQFTAIDNALLLGPDITILGAGCPILNLPTIPSDVYESKELMGTVDSEPYDMSKHGSRHRAALSFAFNNPGCLVFVASQDGPLRCLLQPGGKKIILWNLS